MTYLLTFSDLKKQYEGKNFFEVKEQLTEYATLRKMYICPVTFNSLPALDLDTYRINVHHLKDGTITKIEKDEYDV